MTINANDLNAYTKFIAARGRRVDMDASFVRARIERLHHLIAAGAEMKTPPEKMPQWLAEAQDLTAVARVMAVLETATGDDNG